MARPARRPDSRRGLDLAGRPEPTDCSPPARCSRLVDERHVVGITSNPTIFANAIGGSADYDDQIRELGQRGTPTAEVLRLLTVADIRGACDVLRPVYDATG